jgi:hypothetical protein
MASFYRAMNGMDWPTDPEHGWVRIWDLESWRRIRDESDLRDRSIYADFEEAFLIADHCDSSWWYAANFSRAMDNVSIYLIDGLRPAKLVTASFTAFVHAALADAAAIYPSDREVRS